MLAIHTLILLLTVAKSIDGTFLCIADGMFANPHDPFSFWHCAHGQSFLKQCPATLVWSQKDLMCTWNVVTPSTTGAIFTPTVVIPVTTVTPNLLPSQCSNYTSIVDGTRHVTNTQLVTDNDGAFFSATPTWVRFEGAAGTRLANYSVSTNRCGSETTGWVKDSIEPTVGKTANQTVCLNWTQFKCIWPNKVPMTNCGDYFIYALAAPAIREARYCTM